ncbi:MULTISPECIES: hypothetical protein [Bradyrhizobium]|uniref:Uncharacterized protein n=1 Tax=Bradyrhizobium vignae TaxID=1549949 RepID=A0ABS4A5L4_9BRAD|nr:hypothetical protein [Bradyrhizobium vignae]MBP0115697.1 hypothetical protein [Bradyrhizobium vignae]RXG86999.1 hypothetical protein EAV90_32905 [Bradyrhizobium vignae]
MAALILKELKSIIELSSETGDAGDNASLHYRSRGEPLEAITCIAIVNCAHRESRARWRE